MRRRAICAVSWPPAFRRALAGQTARPDVRYTTSRQRPASLRSHTFLVARRRTTSSRRPAPALRLGFRQRRPARHLPGERRDDRRAPAWDDDAERGAVSQHGTRHVPRCDGRGRRRQRTLGTGCLRGRFRQRRRSGPLRHQLRQEPALSKRRRAHVRRRRGESGRGRRQLVHRLRVRRFRWGRVARFVRGGLRHPRCEEPAARAIRERPPRRPTAARSCHRTAAAGTTGLGAAFSAGATVCSIGASP